MLPGKRAVAPSLTLPLEGEGMPSRSGLGGGGVAAVAMPLRVGAVSLPLKRGRAREGVGRSHKSSSTCFGPVGRMPFGFSALIE